MTRGRPPQPVEAVSWVVALGLALHEQGEDRALERLVCEVLPDGTLLARDGSRRWLVQEESPGPRLPRAPRTPPSLAEDEELDEPPTPVSWVERQQRLAELAMDQHAETPSLPPPSALPLDRITDAGTAVLAWELALGMAGQAAPSEGGVGVQVTPHEGLIIVAATGPHAHKLRAGRLPPGRGFVGYCIDRARPFIVNDVRRDPRHYAEMDTQTGTRTRTVLCVPVAAEGFCFGCLELLNPPGEASFNREMLDRVVPIGAALGARLYRAGIRGRRL